MNTSGIVVALAGAWVLCQVFGGDALGRLGIISGSSSSSSTPKKSSGGGSTKIDPPAPGGGGPEVF